MMLTHESGALEFSIPSLEFASPGAFSVTWHREAAARFHIPQPLLSISIGFCLSKEAILGLAAYGFGSQMKLRETGEKKKHFQTQQLHSQVSK